MCLERFGRATKLRSHKKKDFPNEQDNNNRYLLMNSLIMLDFAVERDPYLLNRGKI